MVELTNAIATSTALADVSAVAAFIFGAGVLIYGIKRIRAFLQA